MITQDFLDSLAKRHGTRFVKMPVFACQQATLPNGVVFSVAYSGMSYGSSRTDGTQLPLAAVEVAYFRAGTNELLPAGDVHGWQNREDVGVLFEEAASLER